MGSLFSVSTDPAKTAGAATQVIERADALHATKDADRMTAEEATQVIERADTFHATKDVNGMAKEDVKTGDMGTRPCLTICYSTQGTSVRIPAGEPVFHECGTESFITSVYEWNGFPFRGHGEPICLAHTGTYDVRVVLQGYTVHNARFGTTRLAVRVNETLCEMTSDPDSADEGHVFHTSVTTDGENAKLELVFLDSSQGEYDCQFKTIAQGEWLHLTVVEQSRLLTKKSM